ncbi:anthranilate phosphoribosyltransferase [Zhihengliuella halotolerans]|uniref:Anthranilate phosphoribosyltransferase n=1 Tax=Zhihengliuella halotolerans TaxID=370736 RepID=A0A4Q8ACM4_9MICC|nr:anthranilate phosphoribosyltransferase [Zhihengliuella halotolerans]RZU61385.1 anthranilate phosphoribosyltransferase [Zhihengliuella halotolerans]
MSTFSATPEFQNWPTILSSLIAGESLPRDAAAWAMSEIMSGNATDVQIAGFLVALRSKGETVDELTGLVDSMVAAARPLEIGGEKLDIVGTGGDRQNTVNISTMAALVCAGAGARIVKHGNRAASSSSGSADVLEALGVNLEAAVESLPAMVDAAGIVFCFAQVFHPSMRYAAVARRGLGTATVFNFLGPLTNPGNPTASAIGCADARMAPLMAGALAGRGRRGLVFRGDDGLDEMTTTATNRVWEVRRGEISEYTVDPTDFGLARVTIEQLRGGDASYNAGVVRDVLAGEKGPARDAVVLNAAAGLVAYDTDATGALDARLERALERAAAAIDEGRAASALERWAAATRA